MPQLRLVLALHHHQPLGPARIQSFEEAYETSYRPLLDVLETRSDIRIALHTSGPLLEWLVERHPRNSSTGFALWSLEARSRFWAAGFSSRS